MSDPVTPDAVLDYWQTTFPRTFRIYNTWQSSPESMLDGTGAEALAVIDEMCDWIADNHPDIPVAGWFTHDGKFMVENFDEAIGGLNIAVQDELAHLGLDMDEVVERAYAKIASVFASN